MTQDTSRAAALARLAELGVKSDPSATVEASAPAVTISDADAIYAGGDVERVLIGPAHLTYRDERNSLLHAFAEVGNTILLTQAQADRLDKLGATATKAKAKELAAQPAAAAPATATTVTGEGTVVDATPSSKTDEELEAMNAKDLIAHVNQHPGDRVRVRGLEGKRDEPRSTVLKATAPGTDDPDEELDGEE